MLLRFELCRYELLVFSTRMAQECVLMMAESSATSWPRLATLACRSGLSCDKVVIARGCGLTSDKVFVVRPGFEERANDCLW